MICPKCGSKNLIINTSVYSKSKRRSLIWNLLMFMLTGGLWLIWMLVRRRKEKIVNDTIATCQSCGYSFKIQ